MVNNADDVSNSSDKKDITFNNPVLESNVPNQVPKQVLISKDDLKIILNILTVCAKRNAFQLEEYKVIGELNDRFAGYVERVRFLEAQNKKLTMELDTLKTDRFIFSFAIGRDACASGDP